VDRGAATPARPLVRPRYYIGLEERTYLADPDEGLVLVGRPDLTASGGEQPTPAPPELAPAASGEAVLSVQVPLPDEVRETYLVVRAAADEEVVAVVELLSPTHKRPGEGRRRYLEKRRAVLASRAHLVEVDLLRAGEPMPTRGADRDGDCRVLISRGDRRPHAELRLFSVRDSLPSFALPLRPGDAEPRVALRAALDEIRAGAAPPAREDPGERRSALRPRVPLLPGRPWLAARRSPLGRQPAPASLTLGALIGPPRSRSGL